MKESLVNSSLKLQVANKIISEDDILIASLRKDSAEARKLAVIAQGKEADASELLESLRVEISSLKRQLREKTDEASSLFATSAASLTVSDAEVDSMMGNAIRPMTQSTKYDGYGNEIRPMKKELTPFQDWKLTHYIFSPEIPKKEDIQMEKERIARGDGEHPAMVTGMLDQAFSNMERSKTAHSKRLPKTPFSQAVTRARSGQMESLRAVTASGRRGQSAGIPQA